MKNFWKFLFLMVCLSVANGETNTLFRPLADKDQHSLSLIKYTPTRFRIQYHGFVQSANLERYIFMVDREIVYLQLNETAPQQFILKQVLSMGQQVLIEDMLTHQLYVLNSGKTSYIPEKFECVLLDKKDHQRFVFSDTQNCYETESRKLCITQKDADLRVWDIVPGKEPMLCVFPESVSE